MTDQPFSILPLEPSWLANLAQLDYQVMTPIQALALPPMLGGEDFAAFSQVAPACYVFIGAGSEPKGFTSSHHSSTFGIDEDAFPVALQLAVDVVRNGPRLAAG